MKRFSLENLRSEFEGCVMVWTDKETKEEYIKGNAWEDLSRSMMYKYFNKSNYIKRVTHGTNYDGTKWVKFYEDYGTRLYVYVD